MLKDAARLVAKGLMLPGDSLSWRVPGRDAFLKVTVQTFGGLPALAEEIAIGPGDKHGWVYGDRQDVGAVLLSSQPWAAAIGQLGVVMPGLFDEQIRHLGKSVGPTFSGASLSGGANAFLLEGRVLCLGMTMARLVCNAELLEKCAKAFVLAYGTGQRVHHIPWLVRMIANRRLLRDERYAAQCHLGGEEPQLASAY